MFYEHFAHLTAQMDRAKNNVIGALTEKGT